MIGVGVKMGFEDLKNLVKDQIAIRSKNQKTWRRILKTYPCRDCGKLTPTKQSYHVLCFDCTKNYLKNLEHFAEIEKVRLTKEKNRGDIKKREYNRTYQRIVKVKERMIDIPRKLQEAPYERTCLKCDRDFIAVGKFNRICHLCTNINADIENNW